MSEVIEDKQSSTPNGPTQTLNVMKAASKVSGIPKKEPLSTVVEDYYLQIMQRPCKEKLVNADTLDISYSICEDEDKWLDCVIEEERRTV